MLYLTQRGSLMRSYIGVLFKKGQKIFLRIFLRKKELKRIDELEKKMLVILDIEVVSKWKIIRPYHFYVEKNIWKKNIKLLNIAKCKKQNIIHV